MSNYGIPYMGSKNKIVDDIVPYVIGRHTNRTTFIDLFVGGGAVSDWLYKNTSIKVVANDIDLTNVDLLAFCRDKDKFERSLDEILTFVNRESFHNIRNRKPTTLAEWYVGFVRIVYSFGNRGDSYLYGEDIEKYKEVIHNAIVFNNYDNFGDMGLGDLDLDLLLKSEIKDDPFNIHKITNRASEVLNIIYNHLKGKVDDAFLNRITTSEHLSRIKRLYDFMNKSKNDNGQVTFTIGDYRKVIDKILGVYDVNNLIVYCDPPYEDTAEYVAGAFNTPEFWDWVRSTKDKYPVYVSSYKAPSDIECVWEQGKRGLFAMNSENNAKVVEKIFYNGYGEVDETLFDLLMGGGNG